MIGFEAIKRRFAEHEVDEESRDEHAEVHTPNKLVEKMLSKIPEEKWADPTHTTLDPAAGIGNFPLFACEKYMEGLKRAIPDPDERYRHIVENLLYMVELQESNCEIIRDIFTRGGEVDIDLNLKCCDALKLEIDYMTPADWSEDELYRWSYRFKRKELTRGGSSIWEPLVEEIGRKRKGVLAEFQISEEKRQSVYAFFNRGHKSLRASVSATRMDGIYDVAITRP